jgi:hypothetical protein
MDISVRLDSETLESIFQSFEKWNKDDDRSTDIAAKDRGGYLFAAYAEGYRYGLEKCLNVHLADDNKEIQ